MNPPVTSLQQCEVRVTHSGLSWSSDVVGTVPLSKCILVHFSMEENPGK